MCITELAQGEIDRLGDMGITLSPDEIVTLNGFAVEAMAKKGYFQEIYAERRVRFGTICFREPTFAHYKFIQDCEDFIDMDGDSGVCFRAYAASLDAKNLPDAHDEELVRGSLLQFQTMIQYLRPRVLQAIVIYLYLGPQQLPTLKENGEDANALRDWVLENVVSGVAVCPSITLADAMSMRPTVFNSLIVQTLKAKDGLAVNGATNKFFKYSSMLEETHAKDKVK